MFLFCLMCCFVTFVSAVSTSELLFETHNKCGCFSYEKCPELQKPSCSIENDSYEGLYKQNSISSDSPELCGKWSLEGFKKELIVSENGTLKISVLFSPMLNRKVILDVQLRYQNQCLDSGNSSPFYLLDMKHSTKHITVPGSSTDFCNKVVEISFPYIFTGCYQLYINIHKQNSEISGGCMSRPFLVSSSYIKEPLNNVKVTHSPSYVAQRQELVFTSVFGNFSHGLKPFSTAVTLKSDVDMSLDDCAGSGNKAGQYFWVERGDCCHGIEEPNTSQPHNMTYCPCKWENDMALDCTFREIKNGNYCVILEFIDPRCEKSSLWTEESLLLTKPCAWSFKIEAKGQISPTETEPYKVTNLYPMVVLYCVFVILVTAAVMFTIHYFKKGKEKKHTFQIENIVEKSLFISEEEEILLLYPRDCEKFMTSMALFRTLLKESCGCKVHDAWDDEIFDKVAESIETWSLPLIHNKNTKVIVILTECSKIIEESYIGDNNFATYREPKAFDVIFAQSVKALNEYFATRFDSYRRVFVVRLDETPVIDFSFHFNRATVYILPHGLQTLVDDLQNGNSTPINKESHFRLKAAIQEYQVYKQQYVNYLNDILNINNNCKILKCLKNGIRR